MTPQLYDDLVSDLVRNGDLPHQWLSSFRAVRRMNFIPNTVWVHQRGSLVPVNRDRSPLRWIDLASSGESVIIQVDDGKPVGPGNVGEFPTSSVSMPVMVARMLGQLDVTDGHRVLEIGTGSGWNAALLAHRLGADQVTTVEIDPYVAIHARKALSGAGFDEVRVAVGNGSLGFAANAPYDRVISTTACHTVPYAWVQQTKPGGRIVTPWGAEYLNFGLLALDVQHDGTATGHLVGTANFMRMRDQRFDSRPVHASDEDDAAARVSYTDLHPADVRNTDYALGAVMALSVAMPNCRTGYTPPHEDPDGDAVLWVIDHHTDSWARLQHKPEDTGPYRVLQFGPRQLWDEVEETHQWWVNKGRPGADRWRFTVTPQGQRIELLD